MAEGGRRISRHWGWIAFFLTVLLLLLWIGDKLLDPIIYHSLNPPRRTTEDYIRQGVKVTPEGHGAIGEEVFIIGAGGGSSVGGSSLRVTAPLTPHWSSCSMAWAMVVKSCSEEEQLFRGQESIVCALTLEASGNPKDP